MKEERINIRVTAEEKKLLQEQASREGRSLSNYLIHLAKRENKKGGSEMDKVKYFTKARSTGEVGWAYIPKSWVEERPDIYLESDSNFINWIEEEKMKNKTMKEVIEILEEITREVAEAKGIELSDKELRNAVSGIYETVSEEDLELTEGDFRKLYKEWMETIDWENQE